MFTHIFASLFIIILYLCTHERAVILHIYLHSLMKKKYTTIIWDLDGTLMDTIEDLKNAVNHALRTNGMKERTLDEVRQFVGNGVRRLVELSVPESMERGKSDPELFEKVFDDFKTYYVEHCQDNTGLYEGIAETLISLKEKGIRMAVVSNKLQRGVTELVNSYVHTVGKKDSIRLCDYMDVAIGERPEIARKPAPDMVVKALEELNVSKDDAVYIGDSEVDVATARNSGLRCISVLWGFRDIDLLKKHGADTFVQHPMEIVSLIHNA